MSGLGPSFHTDLSPVPKVYWLWTDWRMRTIIPTVACLGYITHIYGVESFVGTMENIHAEWFQFLLRASFGSAMRLGYAIRASWYFALAVHVLEGLYVVFICFSKLKLSWGLTVSWFALTCLVGFPSTVRVLRLQDGIVPMKKDKSV
jgi:hypothetical protein